MTRGETSKAASFEILGVDPSATAEEIKSQFRALSRITHPDKGGSAALFRMVNAAYQDALGGASTSEAVSVAPARTTRGAYVARIADQWHPVAA